MALMASAPTNISVLVGHDLRLPRLYQARHRQLAPQHRLPKNIDGHDGHAMFDGQPHETSRRRRNVAIEQAQGFSSTSNPVILIGSTVPLCVGFARLTIPYSGRHLCGTSAEASPGCCPCAPSPLLHQGKDRWNPRPSTPFGSKRNPWRTQQRNGSNVQKGYSQQPKISENDEG